MEQEFNSLIGNKKALAVHFRGTDFRRQYNNHPVFVIIEQEIEKVHELIAKSGYEVIFLATDEKKAVDTFQNEFGNMVKLIVILGELQREMNQWHIAMQTGKNITICIEDKEIIKRI